MTEQQQVENGVKFLNDSQQVPKDWYKRIDLENFNMKSLGDCILGQVRSMIHGPNWISNYDAFGSYEPQLGFDVLEDFDYDNEKEEFDKAHEKLEQAWISKIEEMRRTDELFE